jgi:Tfp pilus assembly protein PilP
VELVHAVLRLLFLCDCGVHSHRNVVDWLVQLLNFRKAPPPPGPPIEQTVTPEVITPEQIAPLHLEVTKEASTPKSDVSPVKHHKRKVLARQRNNNYGYRNVWGYADAYRNGPQRPFSNW